jgi:hypothetical protein
VECRSVDSGDAGSGRQRAGRRREGKGRGDAARLLARRRLRRVWRHEERQGAGRRSRLRLPATPGMPRVVARGPASRPVREVFTALLPAGHPDSSGSPIGQWEPEQQRASHDVRRGGNTGEGRRTRLACGARRLHPGEGAGDATRGKMTAPGLKRGEPHDRLQGATDLQGSAWSNPSKPGGTARTERVLDVAVQGRRPHTLVREEVRREWTREADVDGGEIFGQPQERSPTGMESEGSGPPRGGRQAADAATGRTARSRRLRRRGQGPRIALTDDSSLKRAGWRWNPEDPVVRHEGHGGQAGKARRPAHSSGSGESALSPRRQWRSRQRS